MNHKFRVIQELWVKRVTEFLSDFAKEPETMGMVITFPCFSTGCALQLITNLFAGDIHEI